MISVIMRAIAATDLLLTTTRSVRKRLDLDRPVPVSLLLDCLRIAQQAPTASNAQGWHFLVVTDEAKRAALADIYRSAMAEHLAEMPTFTPPTNPQTRRTYESAAYLGEVVHRVPVLVVPSIDGG